MNKSEFTRRDFLEYSGTYLSAFVLDSYFPTFLHKESSHWVPYFDHGDPMCNKIALTIDDGWHPEKVEQAVDVLSNFGIPATFFPVGTQLEAYPKIWQRAHSLGFEFHNHTYSHADLGNPETDIRSQISRWEEAYESLGLGKYAHKVVLPPDNNGVNDQRLYTVCSRLDYQGVAGWTIDSPGYSSKTDVDDVKRRVFPKIAGGAIILLHFINTDIEVMPDIIATANKKGLEFVVLSELPGIPIY